MVPNIIKGESFGTTKDGKTVDIYTLQNGKEMQVKVMTYGGIITQLMVPDKNGVIADVTLGFDTFKEYEDGHPFFGALVGRVANRIANGQFTLDGQMYKLAINNGPNSLHGGLKGFDKVVWKANVADTKLHLSYVSPDGEENYPGELSVKVTYEVTGDNELKIDYVATTTKATPVNLTNHAYFNLAGQATTNIYDHKITIQAEKFTPKNENGIPTGEVANVEDTVFDLRQPIVIGTRIHDIPGDMGYDHNFCLSDKVGQLKMAARVESSGRVMEAYTNQPGVQLYTANYVKDVKGKDGAIYGQHSALCLETQNYPDAVNQGNFPNCILRPGETYNHSTIYKFSTT